MPEQGQVPELELERVSVLGLVRVSVLEPGRVPEPVQVLPPRVHPCCPSHRRKR